jgi:hypothetical protein
MTGRPEADDLLDRLRAALRAASHPAAGAGLERLRDKGLAHDHVRLAGSGLLARIPKQSQLDLPPDEALAYEAACFSRAAPAGSSPALQGVLAVGQELSRGALLVREVMGHAARLPQQLPAIARSLGAIHGLALPPVAGRAPLLSPGDPLRALVDEIGGQARHLEAGDTSAAATAIRHGLALLQQQLSEQARPGVRLVAFDAHPGNFLVDAAGGAWLVDLEKCRYSYPGLDLAHASLYTSTTWDLDSHAALDPPEVLAFYAHWAGAVGPALAREAQPWHALLRRAMWLWSMTWCVKWRALSGAPARRGGGGEDWSAERSDAALVAHVRERVDHYLGAEAVARVQHELDALERAWAA